MNPHQTSYSNQDISELLENIATAYEIKGKNRFRIIAYQNAAESIALQPQSVHQLWQKDPTILDTIPNIGPHIQAKIIYLFQHHQFHPHIIATFKNIHPATFTFTKVNGIGPKNAYKLTKNLKFGNDTLEAFEQLINYCQQGKIRVLPTFGEKSELVILENTLHYLGRHRRMELKEAEKISQKIISYMEKKFPKVEFIPLGSLRRQTETVGDIDFAAKSIQTEDILNHFIAYPDNIQTITKGPKKASIKIYHEIRVDIMVQPPKTFGSLLQHFTGSKQHNINLRKYALNLGYSLSEYGIKNLKTGKIYTFDNEKDFYNFLKLCYIKPQNRLGEDEIELAQKCYNNLNN